MSGVWTRSARPRRRRASPASASRSNARDELRPAIGIAGIVERVDADDDVARAERPRPSRAPATGRSCCAPARRSTECRGASRSRSRGTAASEVSDEPPMRAQVDVELEMPLDAERARDRARRLDLARVALAVVDGQRVQREALAPARSPRRCRNRARRSAAAIDVTRSSRPRIHDSSRRRATRCTCAAAAAAAPAGGRRASIRTASCGSSTPCTGENSTAAARDGRSWRAIDVARELVVGAVLDDELHLVVRRERDRGSPSRSCAASPLPGHFTSTIFMHRRAARARSAVAAGLEHHGVAARRAAAPSADRRPPAAAARRR